MLLCFSPALLAQEVFRTVDSSGLVSFSDVPTDGAEVLEISTIPANPAAAERQRDMLKTQLEVADALQSSRLAREKARTERMQALAALQPRTIYYQQPPTRYVGGYYSGRYWGRPGKPPGHRPGGPGHPGRPVHPIEPGLPVEPSPVQPPSMRVRLPMGS